MKMNRKEVLARNVFWSLEFIFFLLAVGKARADNKGINNERINLIKKYR